MIIRICEKMAAKIYIFFLSRSCLFISCVFYVNKEELVQQIFQLLRRFIESDFFSSTSHDTKKKRKEKEQKYNFTR